MLIFRIIRAYWRFLSLSDIDLANERLAICNKCDKRKGNTCGVCGCPLFAKVHDYPLKCPHPEGAKW